VPYKRENQNNKKSTLERDEFLELTKSIWTFGAESARKVGHPAPFPVELPLKCIKLYTFENDVVLDPFIGSGTTAVATLMSNRRFIGYDKEKKYVDIAEKRIKEVLDKKKQRKITEVIFESANI